MLAQIQWQFFLSILLVFFDFVKFLTLDFIGILLRLFQSLGIFNRNIHTVSSFHVYLEKLYEIEKNNWVKSAKLKYSLPSKLSIVIEEEKPTFLLKENKNITLLNLEGKKIQDIKIISKDYKDLLILSGDGVENKIFNLLNIFFIKISVLSAKKEKFVWPFV